RFENRWQAKVRERIGYLQRQAGPRIGFRSLVRTVYMALTVVVASYASLNAHVALAQQLGSSPLYRMPFEHDRGPQIADPLQVQVYPSVRPTGDLSFGLGIFGPSNVNAPVFEPRGLDPRIVDPPGVSVDSAELLLRSPR